MNADHRITHMKREENTSGDVKHTFPWHGPPLFGGLHTLYHICAANEGHRQILGKTCDRLGSFVENWMTVLSEGCQKIHAWCVLPDHYHALVLTDSIKSVIHSLELLHDKTAREWNVTDKQLDRTCWIRCFSRRIHSERQKWASMNYIHHNAAYHGFVLRWDDWPFSSAQQYVKNLGRNELASMLRKYPALDCSAGWEEPRA
jgi:putative transposase